MFFLIQFISYAVQIYIWIIIAEIVLSWLVIFDVINTRNPQAQNLIHLIKKATHPVMSRVRRYIPPIGGLDLTPMIVIFGLMLLRNLVIRLLLSGSGGFVL